jgi:hypothetical protein
MKQKIRMLLRRIGLAIARRFASDLRDDITGERLGRALLIPWRGKIHVVGLDQPLRVAWSAQKRLTYWKQEIGFTKAEPVDFPNIREDRKEIEVS